MGRIHRYKGKHILVEFEAERCIHTGDCVRSLPEVFNTQRKGRWVHPDAADAQRIAEVCARCPTGALRARSLDDGRLLDQPPEHNSIQIVTNGPLYIHARMRINGEEPPAYRVALCRCGSSSAMPFCDGSHRQLTFEDSGQPVALPMPGEAAKGELDIQSQQPGPLRVVGPFLLIDGAGKARGHYRQLAFCCCGSSRMKPLCDGSHALIGESSAKLL